MVNELLWEYHYDLKPSIGSLCFAFPPITLRVQELYGQEKQVNSREIIKEHPRRGQELLVVSLDLLSKIN